VSLAIKEMQNKATLRFHFTLSRIAIINNTTNNKCWQGCRGKGTLIHCWWECQLVQPLWKTTWRLFKNLNKELPNDPEIPGLYPKEHDSGYSIGTCTPMFIAIAKLWSGRDEPMWVAILRCMEATLGSSLYSYVYLKLARTLYSSYYLIYFQQN
jgi:hypothetical protein